MLKIAMPSADHANRARRPIWSAMKPEKVLELLGIDQSYGITIEDFIQPAAPQPGAPAMGNMPINESALQDLPVSPDAV